MTQPPLIGRPADTRGGLWSKVLDADRHVHDGSWEHARLTGQHVGLCGVPGCGQQLKPGEPDRTNRHRTFYPAECVGCGHEVTACGPPPPAKPKKGAA